MSTYVEPCHKLDHFGILGIELDPTLPAMEALAGEYITNICM